MRRVLLLIVTVLSATATPVASSTAATPRAVCGAVRGDDGVRYRVVVERGPLRCRTARGVLVDLFAGRGTPHPGRTPGASYTRVGQWRCFFGMGQWECARTVGGQRVAALAPK